MERLAAIGCWGSYPANCRKALMNMLQINENKLPKPFIVQFPMWIVASRDIEVVDYPMLMPHALVHAVWINFRPEFDSLLLGPPGALLSFWTSMNHDDPRFLHHPLRAIEWV